MIITVSLKVGTEENLKRQLDEERRRGERLNQRLLKAEADNARMSKIMGCVNKLSPTLVIISYTNRAQRWACCVNLVLTRGRG